MTTTNISGYGEYHANKNFCNRITNALSATITTLVDLAWKAQESLLLGRNPPFQKSQESKPEIKELTDNRFLREDEITAIRKADITDPFFRRAGWLNRVTKGFHDGDLTKREAASVCLLDARKKTARHTTEEIQLLESKVSQINFVHSKRNFVHRLGKEKRKALFLNFKDTSLNQDEITAIRKADMSHSLFKSTNWPNKVMKGYSEGQLTQNHVAKICLLDACKKADSQTKQYQLHSGGFGKNLFTLFRGLPNNWDLEKIRDGIKKMPLEERQFFLYKTPLLTRTEIGRAVGNQSLDVGNYLNSLFKEYQLGQFIPSNYDTFDGMDSNTLQELVFPPVLLQTILRAQFGDQAIRLKPILGHRGFERFSDTTTRIITIPSPYTQLPGKIHRLINVSEKNQIGFYKHDMYHLAVESANPQRALWTNLALHVKAFNRGAGIELLDRNFPLYLLPETQLEFIGKTLRTPEEKFWYSLALFMLDYKKSESFLKTGFLQALSFIKDNPPSNLDTSLNTLKKIVKEDFGHGNLSRWLRIISANYQSIQK